MREFRVKLGNGRISVGDVMLFKPTEDITICEPTFEKAFVYIDYITEDYNEACIHTLDDRYFEEINTDCLSYVDYRDVKLLISEAKKYSSANYYHDLQAVIDLQEGFDDLLERFDDIMQDNIGALAYDIDCIIETLQYERCNDVQTSWTCKDLEFLKVLYNYCHLLKQWHNF